MSHLEYCACSHPLDHIGKQCGYEANSNERFHTDEGNIAPAARCPCQSGIRVDLATFQLLSDQTSFIVEQGQTLARILAVLEEAAGLKSRLVDAGNGRARVEVKPKIVVVGG